jgi:hypothetical protein
MKNDKSGMMSQIYTINCLLQINAANGDSKATFFELKTGLKFSPLAARLPSGFYPGLPHKQH